MPRVIRGGQRTDSTTPLEGRSREDYSYVAILREQRRSIEYILAQDAAKYGYRDFSSFTKNIFGYFIEYWEKKNKRIVEAKDYSVENVSIGGSKYGVPYSSKEGHECEYKAAFEALKRVKSNMAKDMELINKIQLEEQQSKKQPQ